MTDICLYFQVHQPLRLQKFTFFDIGTKKDYFDKKTNSFFLERITKKCYIPTNKLLLELNRKTNGAFKCSFSISGILLELLEKEQPQVIQLFQDMAKQKFEFFAETYYHSLSYLISKKEFTQQVKKQKKTIKKFFGVKPVTFRNTEAMYNNDIAKTAEKMGFKTIIAEGIKHILGWRSPNYVYKAAGCNIKVLLRNFELSDDISFRFSEKNWKEFPLTADKYVSWLLQSQGDCINLFMDYETFGEHQWRETGILEFLKFFPEIALNTRKLCFSTASEVAKKYPARDEYNAPHLNSWADTDRDLSAWLGNQMQQNAFEEVKKIGTQKIKKKHLDVWRKLQTSDHFYYMCTKWFNDGDVHKYFNHYSNPYDAYLNYMNVLQDFKKRIEKN